MIERAFDSVSLPAPADMAGAGALGYLGASRPDTSFLAACTAAGVPFRFIYESDPNRSQGAYWVGVSDAQWSDRRANEVAYPADWPIVLVVSDGNARDPDTGADAIAGYAEGWARTARRPLGTPYGNRYAVDAALAGFRRSGRPYCGGPNGDGGWLPTTWGADPARDVMGQEANLASPLPGTDLNTVYDDRLFGGGAPEEDEVKPVYIQKQSNLDLGIYVSDGMFKRHVYPDEWQLVLLLNGGPPPVVQLTDVWWDSIPTAGEGGGAAPAPKNLAITLQGTATPQ